MFLGEYQHQLDAKGRLIIPSKFRDDLGQRCVLTKGLDGCIFLFPSQQWDILNNKLSALPLSQPEVRSFTRFLFSSAAEMDCDKQGRIALPQNLQTYADLDKSIMIIGMSTRIELWSVEKWQAYGDTSEKSFEQLAELMSNYGVDF